MIEYNNKKVTPKVYAKHIISDELMKIFDRLKHNPQDINNNWQYLTSKEENTIITILLL